MQELTLPINSNELVYLLNLVGVQVQTPTGMGLWIKLQQLAAYNEVTQPPPAIQNALRTFRLHAEQNAC